MRMPKRAATDFEKPGSCERVQRPGPGTLYLPSSSLLSLPLSGLSVNIWQRGPHVYHSRTADDFCGDPISGTRG